jgi:hypothetical protein
MSMFLSNIDYRRGRRISSKSRSIMVGNMNSILHFRLIMTEFCKKSHIRE